MLRRIGLVFWWVGTLIGNLAGIFYGAILGYRESNFLYAIVIFVVVFAVVFSAMAVVFWSLSFILGGSFWWPPKLEKQ
jgi:hypothetical protein